MVANGPCECWLIYREKVESDAVEVYDCGEKRKVTVGVIAFIIKQATITENLK